MFEKCSRALVRNRNVTFPSPVRHAYKFDRPPFATNLAKSMEERNGAHITGRANSTGHTPNAGHDTVKEATSAAMEGMGRREGGRGRRRANSEE